MKRNAALGYWNGSVPPFGYRTVEVGKKGDKAKKILEIESEEAAIVRKMCDLYLHGTVKARNPKKVAPRTVSGPTLLAGIARCRRCGESMLLRTGKSGRYRYYTCTRRARYGKTACRGESVRLGQLDRDATRSRSSAEPSGCAIASRTG